MASGHVNRTNRPNTWLHRPACKREEKPCQLGAVHTWHKADMPVVSVDVRFRERSGQHLLILCLCASDPKRSSARARASLSNTLTVFQEQVSKCFQFAFVAATRCPGTPARSM